MSGTIIISKHKSFDVRTIDFYHIINALRSQTEHSETAKMLIETFDKFGMNMLCADELNAHELKKFGALLREMKSKLEPKDEGLAVFFEMICAQIDAEARSTD